MKQIQIPLSLLVIVIVLYGVYKIFTPSALTPIEMEILVESAGSTQYLTSVQRRDNDRMLADIEKLVETYQNRTRDVKQLEIAEEVRGLTHAIFEKSSKLRVDAIQSVGGSVDEVTGRDRKVSVNDKDILELIFLTKNLRDTLVNLTESELPAILVSPSNEELSSFNYFDYYFKDKTLAVFLLNLSRMENEVASLERDGLQLIGSVVNYVDVAFDSIVPIVNTESKIIRVGEPYQAEITFGAIDPDANYLFSIDNKAIPSPNGVGSLQLSPDYFPSRTGEQKVKGAITLFTPFGNRSYGKEHNFTIERK